MKPIHQIFETLKQSNIPYPVIFLIFVLVSIFIGEYTPRLIALIVQRFLGEKGKSLAKNFIFPIQKTLQISSTLILVSLSLVWLERDLAELKKLIEPFLNLAIVIHLAWLFSRLFRQIFRIYGVEIIRQSGLEVDEISFVFEAIANVTIGIIATISYAQTQNLELGGILAGLGIGGLAISFAAAKTLEQIFGTIVLYLDRPFIPGEYIRLPDGLYGRVESIGLRSTKIRATPKNTLFIIPNNTLTNLPIENITRGKKVKVLLSLDFFTQLTEPQILGVQQVIQETLESQFEIDPGSTRISFRDRNQVTGAGVSFLILGCRENSTELRQKILEEFLNNNVCQRLQELGIELKMQELNIEIKLPLRS